MANLYQLNDWMSEVELLLPESPVGTTMTAAVTPGSQTVAVGSVTGMYVGAQVVVGSGNDQEIVSLTAVDPVGVTLSAVFANSHPAGEAVEGATFWAGQPSNPLFTQQEILGYFAEVEA